MCSCISTYIYVHPTPHVSSTPYALLHGNLDSSVWQCVCVSQSPYHWSHTLIKMYTSISTCIHVHLTYHVCFTFLNSYMETWVSLCGSVCVCLYVLQSSCFGPTPWLKCVHASVHVIMSIWVQNIGTSTLHSYMETWVPGCGTVCMFQPVHFWSHTLFRIGTCISACIYVHPNAHVTLTPNGIVTWETGCLCVAMCVYSSHPASGHTPCLECVHASIHEFMPTWLSMSAPPLIIVWWKPGCPCVGLWFCLNHPTSTLTPWLECVHIYMSTWFLLSAAPLFHSYIQTWSILCGNVYLLQWTHF